MTSDARQRARSFLIDAHLLTPAEAREALDVAATVLNTGLARLAADAEAQNAAACAEAAHSLKGNLLNLGLPELAHIAQQATDLARRGDIAAAKAAGQTLVLALATLLPGERCHAPE
ncbi:Hpt domain-containing protein [Solidesulfovibrio sp.]